ncbi:MAG: VOC family protein [Gemmatimonadota bacterium]
MPALRNHKDPVPQDGCMGIAIKTPGIHHISLRTTDLARAKQFYVELLGFPVVVETGEVCLVLAGTSLIGLRGPVAETPKGDAFDPFRVGLDHFALTCPDMQELERIAAALENAGIWNTGIKKLDAFNAHYVGFKDPDGIKLEMWLG